MAGIQPRLILAVDTTTPHGSVAVLEEDRVLAEIAVASPTTHSARLLSSIHVLLESVGLDIRAVDGFAVTPGPGSFTGIRIGLSTVKAFAFASGRPVAPVSSLRALAWKFREVPGLAAPMLDAKKGEIYAALFEVLADGLVEIVPQGAYAPDVFLASLPPDRAIAVIGSGIGICGDKIVRALRSNVHFSLRSPFTAAEVGLLGRAVLAANQGVSAEALEPLYFRKSQAEDKD
jgi:tRNA threonylcarbamoyladenosine biosynthesis protein TsaB